jgi:hypothetical protein
VIYQDQGSYEETYGIADVLYDDRVFEPEDVVVLRTGSVLFILNKTSNVITYLVTKNNGGFLKVHTSVLTGNGGALFAPITYDKLLDRTI